MKAIVSSAMTKLSLIVFQNSGSSKTPPKFASVQHLAVWSFFKLKRSVAMSGTRK